MLNIRKSVLNSVVLFCLTSQPKIVVRFGLHSLVSLKKSNFRRIISNSVTQEDGLTCTNLNFCINSVNENIDARSTFNSFMQSMQNIIIL